MTKQERHREYIKEKYHADHEYKFVLGNCWNKGWSKEKILAEVAKCRPLCANCHRKEHWDEEAQCFAFDR